MFYSDNKRCLLNMNLEFTFHVSYIDIYSLDIDERLSLLLNFVLSAAVIQKYINCI